MRKYENIPDDIRSIKARDTWLELIDIVNDYLALWYDYSELKTFPD